MNLFELFVKIGVDDQASKKLSNIAGKLGKGLKTAAKIGTAAVSAAAAGIAALTTAAIKNYAEYEQLVGGVETLFKNSADTVQKYAANAYKTAGLSANEYMSTVTSFSASLLQSLGGDTEKAAKYADMAVSDMSDNANKMGTDMELIQNAYQGFAKQNYTMLDNLKLGYGGTKTEMERLVADAAKVDSSIDANSLSFGNVVAAINVVQKEMGIYGTTALEAEKTISGSLNAMKGAWSNLITGLADDTADFDGLINNFVESVSTFGSNIGPQIASTINGVMQLIDKLLPQIIEAIPKLVIEFVPKLQQAGFNALKALVKGIKDNAKTIVSVAKDLILSFIDGMVDMLPDIIDAAIELLSAIIEAIPDVVRNIAKNMPKIIKAIVQGLAKGAVAIGKAILSLFIPFDDAYEEERKKFDDFLQGIESFESKVQQAAEKAVDLSNALSKSGRSISEVEDKIEKAENSITKILKKGFDSQEGLRQQDIKNIEKYNKKIQELEEEKLSIYQDQQLAELRKIQLNIANMTQEEAAQYVGQAQAAYEEANKIVEEALSNRLIIIENKYKAMGDAGTEAYQKELEEANKWAQEQKEINRTYYAEATGILANNKETTSSIAKGWRDVYKEINAIFKAQQKPFSDAYGFTSKAIDLMGRVFGVSEEEIMKIFKNIDVAGTNAFLSLQLRAVAAGETISRESEEAIFDILRIFDNKKLIGVAGETGEKVFRKIIEGLEEYVPELKNASEMTVNEMVNALQKAIYKREPITISSVDEFAKYIIDGFAQGIKSRVNKLISPIKLMADTVTNTFKKVLGINSPSRVFKQFGKFMVDGLVEGWEDNIGAAENMIDNSLAFDDTDYQISTAATSIGDFNSNFASKNTSQSVNVTVGIEETSNALGLARALLPLLKIVEKEVYA